MNFYQVLLLVLIILNVITFKRCIILTFKVSYYETKLLNRGIDIASVENITLWQIIKL